MRTGGGRIAVKSSNSFTGSVSAFGGSGFPSGGGGIVIFIC